MPALSVIVPIFNVERHLPAALTSLRSQTFGDFEAILVDDGSTDRSTTIASSHGDPRIRLLKGSRNCGPAHARNRGLDEARGDFVSFFDGDDVASADLFALELTHLKRNPGLAGVGAWHELISREGAPMGLGDGFKGSAEKLGATMLFENVLATSTLMFRRDAIGNRRFDETLPVASDYEMWTRILQGGRAEVLPTVLVKYRVHDENISHRKKENAEACVRGIAGRQLRYLGIEPTPEQLDLHRSLRKLSYGTPKAVIYSIQVWLSVLADANARRRIYDLQAFLDVLAAQWFHACYSGCGHGWWTWKTFKRFRLARHALLSGQSKRRFFVRLARGEIKRHFVKYSWNR